MVNPEFLRISTTQHDVIRTKTSGLADAAFPVSPDLLISPQQMLADGYPRHRATGHDVDHIESWKNKWTHGWHPTPRIVLSKWTISATKYAVELQILIKSSN